MKEVISCMGALYTGCTSITQFLSGSSEVFALTRMGEFNLVRDIASLIVSPNENIDEFIKKVFLDGNFLWRLHNANHDYTFRKEEQRNFLISYVRLSLHFLVKVLPLRVLARNFLRMQDIIKLDGYPLYTKDVLGTELLHILRSQLISGEYFRNLKPFSQLINRSALRRGFVGDDGLGTKLLIKEVRIFIDDMLSMITDKDRCALIGFVFSINEKNANYWDKIFDIKRRIFVTRDPRDSYCSYIKRATDHVKRGGVKSEQYAYSDEEAFKYMRTYLSLHKSAFSLNTRKLVVRFEDFVLNHEKEVDRICDFLEISKENIDRSVYDINYSKSRIGLWKQYPNQDLMKHIASELKDYLYEV